MFIQKQADHREECWLVPKTKAFFTKSSIVDYKSISKEYVWLERIRISLEHELYQNED